MSESLRAIASDLSYRVLERRRLLGELGPCTLDSQNRRLHNIPCAVVQREAFAADREAVRDSFQGEAPRFFTEGQ
jgi:hypothetical protein